MTAAPPVPDHLPPLPRGPLPGIGCVGAGFIMADCHLVAYAEAGIRPVAITSRRPEAAAAVAAGHGIPRVHATLDGLLDDPAVEVLDIAVPPDVQPAVIEAALARAGRIRGILAQKPLAPSYAEARRLVERCEAAGVTLVVTLEPCAMCAGALVLAACTHGAGTPTIAPGASAAAMSRRGRLLIKRLAVVLRRDDAVGIIMKLSQKPFDAVY